MNHQELVSAISKRLPYLKRRDVAAVLEVMTELWLAELVQPGQTITLADLGKLSVEVQTFHVRGSVRRHMEHFHGSETPETVKRVYVRFRPTTHFRQAVLATYTEEETKR
jgi:nucleoid DNA-binding protein